tara:strand:+ start:1079 stop:2344 length:1266 start_codon:yes stop_codon:yes gene_type:complete
VSTNQTTSDINVSPEDARAFQANIWRFYLFRFFVDFQLWLPIWFVYLLDERGISLKFATLLDVPFWLLLILMEVPTGAIADRWGRKVSLSYGVAANAVAVVVFGIAGNYGLLLASYMVWAVAWTLYSGADSAFIYDSLRAVKREGEYTKIWGRVRAIQAVGAVLGLGLGAQLAELTNLWLPIVASGGLMAIAWLVSITFKEPPRFEDGEEQLSYIDGAKQAFRVAFGKPSVRMMMLLMATVMGIGVGMQILQQPFLSHHEVNYGNFGWFPMPGQALSFFAALLAVRIISVVGLVRLVVLIPVAVMTTAVGLGAVDHVAAFLFYPISTMMYALSFPLISDYLNQRIPSAQRATILSIHSLLFSLVLVIAEPVLGWIGDETSLLIAYRTAAIAIAVTVPPLLIFWLRAHRSETLITEEVVRTP